MTHDKCAGTFASLMKRSDSDRRHIADGHPWASGLSLYHRICTAVDFCLSRAPGKTALTTSYTRVWHKKVTWPANRGLLCPVPAVHIREPCPFPRSATYPFPSLYALACKRDATRNPHILFHFPGASPASDLLPSTNEVRLNDHIHILDRYSQLHLRREHHHLGRQCERRRLGVV